MSGQSDPSPRFRPRALLTEADAIEIYLCRRTKLNRAQHGAMADHLAKRFKVSQKTIRDIWNRRTWSPETRHLWTEGELPMIRAKPQKVKRDEKNVQDLQSHIIIAKQEGGNEAPPPTTSLIPHTKLAWPTIFATSESAQHRWLQASECERLPATSPISCDQLWRPALQPPPEERPASPPGSWAPITLVEANSSLEMCVMAGAANPDDPFHADWPYW